MLVMASVGEAVSKVSVGVEPAPPALPAASVYRPLTTVMLAVPALVLGVGVKVALRVRPEPLMAPRAPPLTTTSPLEPFQAKVLPGSSLKVKVMVAVPPERRVSTLLVMASVGEAVSRT